MLRLVWMVEDLSRFVVVWRVIAAPLGIDNRRGRVYICHGERSGEWNVL